MQKGVLPLFHLRICDSVAEPFRPYKLTNDALPVQVPVHLIGQLLTVIVLS
jgi:hypothetical protein